MSEVPTNSTTKLLPLLLMTSYIKNTNDGLFPSAIAMPDQKWIDLRQTKTIMISGTFYIVEWTSSAEMLRFTDNL